MSSDWKSVAVIREALKVSEHPDIKTSDILALLKEHDRFQALADRQHELTWTTEKPTQAGWYWWKVTHGAGAGIPVVVELVKSGKALIARGSVNVPLNALDLTGHWSGPLRQAKDGERKQGTKRLVYDKTRCKVVEVNLETGETVETNIQVDEGSTF